MRKLFYSGTDQEAQIGDFVRISGIVVRIRSIREGFTPGSTGRVYVNVRDREGQIDVVEFTPSELNAEWREVAIDKQVGEPLEKVSFSYSAYPENIMHTVREDLGLDMLDSSQDDIIDQMSRDEIFDRILNYNGLINHGDLVRQWVNDIYSIDLTDTN